MLSQSYKTDLPLDKRVELFDHTAWGQGLDYTQVRGMARYFDLYEFPEGLVLFREGMQGDTYMAVIVQGSVKIVKQDVSGIDKEICTLSIGKTFGEMSLLDDSPRSASAIAAEDVSLLVLTKEQFVAMSTKAPQLAVHLLMELATLLAQRLRRASGKLVDYLDE